jgi:sulfur carrier protein
MNAIVNGRERTLPADATVEDVVTALGHDPAAGGVAVALNGEVVPRRKWDITPVEQGARIEVLAAVQGG